MRLDCLEKRLAKAFGHYSGLVVLCPLPFIVIPIFITIGLSTGLVWHGQAFMKDELELYTPTDAQARVEVRELDSLFHINDSDPFYATRRYDIKRAGYIIITHRDEDEDVLNPLVMHAAMQLWSIVQSLTVEDKDDRRINYPGICVKFPIPPEFVRTLHKFFSPNMTTPDQICVSNPLVEMFKLLLVSDRSFVNQSIDEMTLGQITEAIHLDAGSIIHLLGGVTLDSEKRIAGAKAMMLPYALRHSARGEDWLAEQWELRLADFLLHYDSPVIRANWWTYETLAAESARDRNQLIRLAVGGVISAAMAIASAIGLLLLLGFGMTSVAYSMPFIVFSVGVDNVFILLSAWRSSPTHLSLQKRMEETFADAGVSITVTSLTDFISFAVGCATPFPSVQMFCAYAVTAVLFTYVYQLTFFAGIMVYTNRREMDNRNCLTFMKIKKDESKSTHQDRSFEKNHLLSQFFRTTYSDILLNPFVRVLIIICFLIYLGVAIWGCTEVKLGLEPNDLLPDNSYGKQTLRLAEKYFADYGSTLHVWMYNLSEVDIGPRRIWTVLDKEIELYEYTEFTGAADSWLRTYLAFTKQSGLLITQDNFVYILRNVFLSQPQFGKYRR
nr:Patched domain containing protein [Haemonchus contortus]